jgi:radical SAM protein with 4Fe4S-binding SPASM domain
MSVDLFEEILAQIATTASVLKFNFMGEPLLHPRLSCMIEQANRLTSARTIIFTNGTLLTRANGISLIESGLDEIVISIDAFSEGRLAILRRGINRDHLFAQLEDFLLVKGSRKPNARINCVGFPENATERRSLIEYWDRFNCKVEVSAVNSWGGQFHGSSSAYAHSVESPFAKSISNHRHPCAELWYKATITHKGYIVLCCNDFDGKHRLGDLNADSLRDIWNSDKAWNLRDSHQQQNFAYSPLCTNCLDWTDHVEQERMLPQQGRVSMRP